MKEHTDPQTCVVYVGRTEGEQNRWGKVGRVREEGRLDKRTKEFKTADRDFWFVTRAAFQVVLPDGVSAHTFETKVQDELAFRGIKRRGEQFLPPNASMELLVREVEDVIASFQVDYEPLHIEALRARFEALNRQVRAELDGIIASMEPCPYQAFLDYHSSAPWGDRLRRSGSRDRELITLGHLVRDLAAGSGVAELRLDFGHDTLVVYPPSLRAACFQAGAEVDLVLPTTLRFTARPTAIEDLAAGPAMAICRSVPEEFYLDRYEIPGSFLWSGEGVPEEVRFTPEHLACLSQIGMDEEEPCFYHGFGTRAMMPIEVMPLIEANPKLLPGIRFWLGLNHAHQAGIHLHGYRLPAELHWLAKGLADAAAALASVGLPVPEPVQAWVRVKFFNIAA